MDPEFPSGARLTRGDFALPPDHADHHELYDGYAKKTNECRKRLDGFGSGEIEGNRVYPDLASAARGWVMVGYDLTDGSLFILRGASSSLDYINRRLARAEAAREGASAVNLEEAVPTAS